MKHLTRCVPTTLSLILSLTSPGGLLADTGPFLSNSAGTVSSDLIIAAPQSSLSHRVDEQPRIILATGFGSLGRNVSKGAKAATKATPPPPRPKSVPPGAKLGKDVDANDLPSPPLDPPNRSGYQLQRPRQVQPSAYPDSPSSPTVTPGYRSNNVPFKNQPPSPSQSPVKSNYVDLPDSGGNTARQSSGASWFQRSNVAPPPRSKPSALKVAAYAAGTVFAGGVLVGVGQAVYAGLIQGGVIEPIPGDHVYDIYRPSNNQ